MFRIVKLTTLFGLVLVASCANRPREWTSNDWARLSQAVGQELNHDEE